jgi:hypothetical protein
VGHIVYLLLLLISLVPAAATTQVLNNNNSEYLALLGQKGTQIIADILQSEDALKANASNRPALEMLRNDLRLMTLEGDHLQSVMTIALRMRDPADRETALLFVKVIAEEISRRVRPLRDDVNAIAATSGTPAAERVQQVLFFMDEFANVVDAIAREPQK